MVMDNFFWDLNFDGRGDKNEGEEKGEKNDGVWVG